MNAQKGFIVPIIITIIALLIAGGGTYVYFQNKSAQQNNNSSISANMDISDAASSKDTVNNNPTITSQIAVKSNVNVENTSVKSNTQVKVNTPSSDTSQKTFTEDKFTINYPKEWIQSIINTHAPDYIMYDFKKKDGTTSLIVVSKNSTVINAYVKGPIPLDGTEGTPKKTEFTTRGMHVIKWDAAISDYGTLSNITTYVITKENDSQIVYVTDDTELFNGITLY